MCGHFQSFLRYALLDCVTAASGTFHRRGCRRANAQLRHAGQPQPDADVKIRPLFKARVTEVAKPVIHLPAPKLVRFLLMNHFRYDFATARLRCVNTVADKETLAAEVKKWQDDRNGLGAVMDWRFTTEDARVKLKRLYPSI